MLVLPSVLRHRNDICLTANPVPLIPEASDPEPVEEEEQKGTDDDDEVDDADSPGINAV